MSMISSATLPFWAFPLLFVAGLIAGFVDSIAGGGGLITLPVILSSGLPVQLALGTNKLQATFGSGSAAWFYRKSKLVKLSECGLGVFCTILGATAGTICVQHLDPNTLRRMIPILMILLVVYVLFRPKFGEADIHPRMSPRSFYICAGLGMGFYDGFLGPGAGSFWTMAFMLGLGFNLTKATGYTKVMNFASNVTSLFFFAIAGQVHILAGLSMGAGQLIGAKIGSGMVVARGTKFIRPIFIIMVLAVTLKLLYDAHRR